MRRANLRGGSDTLTLPNHPLIKAPTVRAIPTYSGITSEEFLRAYGRA